MHDKLLTEFQAVVQVVNVIRRISSRWKAASHVGKIGEPAGRVFLGSAVKAPPQKQESKKRPCACARLRSGPSQPSIGRPRFSGPLETVSRSVEGFLFRQGTFLLPSPPPNVLISGPCVCTILTSNWSQVYVKNGHFTS